MHSYPLPTVSCKTDFRIFIGFVYPLGVIVLLLYTLLFFFATDTVTSQTQITDAGCIHKATSHPQKVQPDHSSAILAPFGPLMR
jgi:hypothetical protein